MLLPMEINGSLEVNTMFIICLKQPTCEVYFYYYVAQYCLLRTLSCHKVTFWWVYTRYPMVCARSVAMVLVNLLKVGYFSFRLPVAWLHNGYLNELHHYDFQKIINYFDLDYWGDHKQSNQVLASHWVGAKTGTCTLLHENVFHFQNATQNSR